MKSKNTKPEKIVRSTLHSLGYRFRLHKENLSGVPDIVLAKYLTAIFVHGCFWHQHPGCPKAKRPTTNISFWDKKLDENIERDISSTESLKRSGWRVLIVWECQTKNVERLKQQLEFFLHTDAPRQKLTQSDQPA